MSAPRAGSIAAGYQPGPGRPAPQGPLEELGNPAVVGVGDWICLSVRNLSRQVLNVVVLDLRPGWSIRQIYPARRLSQYEPLEPGEEKRLPLRASLDRPRKRGRDVLKVFATTGVVDFRAIEQPKLEEWSVRIGEGVPPDPFQELVETLSLGPSARSLEPRGLASWEWTVEQIELEVVTKS